MPDDPFETLDAALRSGGAEAVFKLLVEQFRREKNYPLLFETRVMQSRRALGLPPVQSGSLEEIPEDKRGPHERAYIDAAREVGGLYLTDGDIPRAWHYFRAIGEPGPVAAAIEELAPAENLDAIIEIALHERVHPRKGFELLLAGYGICRAITFFGHYPDRATRTDCIRLLVRTLHRELLENLKRAIAKTEGVAPDTQSITELIAARDWLFGEYDYYVDTSHLISILGFSLELEDREPLALAIELAEYGTRLSQNFQFCGEPPFESCQDHGIYLRGLNGECPGKAMAHFRSRATRDDPRTGEALVNLLARQKQYREAVDASLEYLDSADASRLQCPSVYQLCQMAGDYARLRELARQRGDLLHFAAASIEG